LNGGVFNLNTAARVYQLDASSPDASRQWRDDLSAAIEFAGKIAREKKEEEVVEAPRPQVNI
jgi:hypothetical protein